MAFNWKTFRTRTLTAIVFVIVMLGGLLWNKWSFLVLFSIIHFGCWWEFLVIIEKIRKTRFHTYSKLGFMLMGYTVMLLFLKNDYQIGGYTIAANLSFPISLAGFIILITGILSTKRVDMKSFGLAALGWIYISLGWGAMIDMYRAVDFHVHDTKYVFGAGNFPLFIIACIWINDTMAYIVGSLMGKTPLSKISPKKTWEGTVGGIILTLIIVYLFFRVWISDFGSLALVAGILACIIAITGTFGDLLESKLKRLAGLKDSGTFMPGHGGFLDRFDSLLIAVLTTWATFKIFLLILHNTDAGMYPFIIED